MLFSAQFFSREMREVKNKKLLMLSFWSISVSKISKSSAAVFVSWKGNVEKRDHNKPPKLDIIGMFDAFWVQPYQPFLNSN